jgi:hypothetical protein
VLHLALYGQVARARRSRPAIGFISVVVGPRGLLDMRGGVTSRPHDSQPDKGSRVVEDGKSICGGSGSSQEMGKRKAQRGPTHVDALQSHEHPDPLEQHHWTLRRVLARLFVSRQRAHHVVCLLEHLCDSNQ